MVKALQQPARQIGRDGRAAIGHLQHRLGVVAEPRILDEIAGGAKLKGMQHLVVVFHDGDDDGFGGRPIGFQVVDELEALAIAQVQIHQQHVEFMLLDGLAPFAHAAGLGHQHGALIGHELLGNDAPHVRIVIDEQHAHRLFDLAGHEVRPHGRWALVYGKLARAWLARLGRRGRLRGVGFIRIQHAVLQAVVLAGKHQRKFWYPKAQTELGEITGKLHRNTLIYGIKLFQVTRLTF